MITKTVQTSDLEEMAKLLAEMDSQWFPPRRYAIERAIELNQKMLGDQEIENDR